VQQKARGQTPANGREHRRFEVASSGSIELLRYLVVFGHEQ